MRTRFAVMFVAALAASVSSAQAFRAANSLEVNKVDANVFEVVGRPGVFSEDYWCGAGDYARRALGVPWNTDIYIARELGKSQTTGGRSAVQFTLDPAAAGVTPWEGNWVNNILTLGYSMSTTGAFGKCDALRRGSFF